MVLLLGGGGYVGAAIARALAERGEPFVAPSHRDLDVSVAEALRALVRAVKPRFAVSAVGFTGRPDVDGTEREKLRCLVANTVVPGVLAQVFADEGVRWGQVSSGCIYDGCRPGGTPFLEDDPPAFALHDPRAGWYARTKAMAEALLEGAPGCLVWRMRIPFDCHDGPRNYLSKILRYERLLEVRGSISERGEFARAAVDSLARGLPAGTYNLTNPGVIATSELAQALERHGLAQRPFQYFRDVDEFLAQPGRVYRATSILSCDKALAAGLALTEVHEAVERALERWIPAEGAAR